MSLVAVSFLWGAFVYAGAVIQSIQDFRPYELAILAGMAFFIFYFLPATTYIALIYFIYMCRRRLSMKTLLILSAPLGLLTLFMDRDPEWIIAGSLAAMLLVTIAHLLATRWFKMSRQ